MTCANVGQIELVVHTELDVSEEWEFLGVALNCGALRELLEQFFLQTHYLYRNKSLI